MKRERERENPALSISSQPGATGENSHQFSRNSLKSIFFLPNQTFADILLTSSTRLARLIPNVVCANDSRKHLSSVCSKYHVSYTNLYILFVLIKNCIVPKRFGFHPGDVTIVLSPLHLIRVTRRHD